jgi:hypothetical protein
LRPIQGDGSSPISNTSKPWPAQWGTGCRLDGHIGEERNCNGRQQTKTDFSGSCHSPPFCAASFSIYQCRLHHCECEGCLSYVISALYILGTVFITFLHSVDVMASLHLCIPSAMAKHCQKPMAHQVTLTLPKCNLASPKPPVQPVHLLTAIIVDDQQMEQNPTLSKVHDTDLEVLTLWGRHPCMPTLYLLLAD